MTWVTPTPEQLCELTHERCRPSMVGDNWCINAAAILRLVLRDLGLPSWPVQVSILHANRAYSEHVAAGLPEGDLAPWYEAEGDDPYCVWAHAETRAQAARGGWQPETGLPGHVLTWVPSWSSYLDPSAGQFTRADHGIHLEPTVWAASKPPPWPAEYAREDGGVSVIMPSTLRGFTTSGAWVHRNDATTRELALRVLHALPREIHSDGGREPAVPRGE